MNRFKKYVQSKGIKLEQNYPWLPYDVGSVTVEAVFVNAEKCTVYTAYNVGTGIQQFDKYISPCLFCCYISAYTGRKNGAKQSYHYIYT